MITVDDELGLDTLHGRSPLPGQPVEAKGSGVFFRGGLGYSF